MKLKEAKKNYEKRMRKARLTTVDACVKSYFDFTAAGLTKAQIAVLLGKSLSELEEQAHFFTDYFTKEE